LKALGLPINRTSMSRWLAEIAQLVSPIVTKMSKRILSGRVIQSDATTMPVIKKGLGKAHRDFVWVYRGDADYPYDLKTASISGKDFLNQSWRF